MLTVGAVKSPEKAAYLDRLTLQVCAAQNTLPKGTGPNTQLNAPNAIKPAKAVQER